MPKGFASLQSDGAHSKQSSSTSSKAAKDRAKKIEKGKDNSTTQREWPFDFPLPPHPLETIPTTVKRCVSHACECCFKLRIKCDRHMPCSRCWRLNLTCTPQPRYLDPLLSSARQAPRRSSSIIAGDADKGDEGDGGKETKKKQQKKKDDEKELSPPALQSSTLATTTTNNNNNNMTTSCSSNGSSNNSPLQSRARATLLAELRFCRQDPGMYASMCFGILQRMHAEGNISRERLVRAMSRWRRISLLVGGDITWGLASQIGLMMEITPAELEEHGLLALDPTPEQRKQLAEEAVQRMEEKSQALKRMERFRTVDVAAGALLMIVYDGREAACACNDLFAGLFGRPSRKYEDKITQKCLHLFLEASVVCPDDREEYMEAYLQLLFAERVPLSQNRIFKAVAHDGEIRLFLIHARYSRLGVEEEIILRLEPAPPSRHIAFTSFATYTTIARNFRRATFQERVGAFDGCAHQKGSPPSSPPQTTAGAATGTAAATATATTAEGARAEAGRADIRVTPIASLSTPVTIKEAEEHAAATTTEEMVRNVFNLTEECAQVKEKIKIEEADHEQDGGEEGDMDEALSLLVQSVVNDDREVVDGIFRAWSEEQQQVAIKEDL